MRIRILVTGGTFDKEYNELAGTLFFKHTHVPEMLRLGRCRLDVAIEPVMMIDSLDMTAADRARVVERCRAASERAIVVTHGTDTMVEIAQVLAAARLDDKTIVLTGAMVPYAFGSSDGLFNLGSAVSFAQVLAPGVYVAMNGMHFRWDECRKNRETGMFERPGNRHGPSMERTRNRGATQNREPRTVNRTWNREPGTENHHEAVFCHTPANSRLHPGGLFLEGDPAGR